MYATLRRARDLQLVVEDSGEDDDRFAFRHALTREAIYGEMLRAESRAVHERLAQLLAEEPQPDASAIAEHAFRARNNALAAVWCERAGDDAFAVFSYVAAAQAYERAYDAATDPARRAAVALSAADARYAVGDLARAIDGYRNAADAALAAGDRDTASRLRIRRARMLFEQGRPDASIEDLDALIADPETSAVKRIEAQVMAAGLVAFHTDAHDVLRRLAEIDEHTAGLDAAITARIASTYAYAYAQLGRAAEGRAALHRCSRARARRRRPRSAAARAQQLGAGSNSRTARSPKRHASTMTRWQSRKRRKTNAIPRCSR